MSLTKSCMFSSSVGAFLIEANIEFNLQHIQLRLQPLLHGLQPSEWRRRAQPPTHGDREGACRGCVQRAGAGEAEGAKEEKGRCSNSGCHAHALAAARAHGVEQGSNLSDANAWVSKAAGLATSAGPQVGTAASYWALKGAAALPGRVSPRTRRPGCDHT